MPRKLVVFLLFLCLNFSCNFAQKGKEPSQKPTTPMVNTTLVLELNPEQQAAFDALNTIQVSTDQQNRFYSTFSNIGQDCYPPDTSVVILQAELLEAMNFFVEKHCTQLSKEKRDTLAKTAVLAQAEYTVFHCLHNSPMPNYENGLPRQGTWVMPGVLGRRDILMIW